MIARLIRTAPALLLVAAVPTVATAQTRSEVKPSQASWQKLPTRYQAARDFPFRTPTETMRSIDASIPLPSSATFAASPGEYKLTVDTTGDGRPNASAKGAYDTIQLPLTYEDGTRQPYTIYLTHSGTRWKFRRHCYRYTKYNGTPIYLIDDDHDGYYDGYGADAMVVGRSRYASFLSRVISIKGKLYEFKTNRPGTYVWVRPYEGPTGKLDLGRKFRAAGRLGAAVVSNGQISFDAARPTVVPVGSYTLTWGAVWKGRSWVRIRAHKTLEVTAGKTTHLAWGAPFKLNFSATRRGTQVTVSPSTVNVTGSAGETYHTFYPHALTPGVRIRHKHTRKQLNAGTMCLG